MINSNPETVVTNTLLLLAAIGFLTLASFTSIGIWWLFTHTRFV